MNVEQLKNFAQNLIGCAYMYVILSKCDLVNGSSAIFFLGNFSNFAISFILRVIGERFEALSELRIGIYLRK